MFQAESVRDAAWGCQWIGTPVPFVRSLSFIINMANKEIVLTAGKFVPVSKATLMNVGFYLRSGCKPAQGYLNSLRLSVSVREILRISERIFRNIWPWCFNIICQYIQHFFSIHNNNSLQQSCLCFCKLLE